MYIPGLARAREDPTLSANVDGEGCRVIQEIDVAIVTFLDYKLLPTDASCFSHENL